MTDLPEVEFTESLMDGAGADVWILVFFIILSIGLLMMLLTLPTEHNDVD